MKKITHTLLLIAVIAIGISSCGKDGTTTGTDVADKYVGNWNGIDSIFLSGVLFEVETSPFTFKKINENEVWILGLPDVGDSLKATVDNNSIAVTYGSDDGYGSQLDAQFNFISTNKFRFSVFNGTGDHRGIIQK